MNINEEYVSIIFLHGATAPCGPGSLQYQVFAIILRHTTLARTPLDERRTWHRDLCLQHTTLTRKIYPIRTAAFESTIATSEGPKTHAFTRGHRDRLKTSY